MALTKGSTGAQALLQAIGSGQLIGQAALAALLANFPQDNQDGIIAHSGGTQAPAFPLIYGINRVITVAAGNDSVMAPFALPGLSFILINDAASNGLKIFGQVTVNPITGVADTIDAVANVTGNAMAAAKRAIFFCPLAGLWISMAGAVIS